MIDGLERRAPNGDGICYPLPCAHPTAASNIGVQFSTVTGNISVATGGNVNLSSYEAWLTIEYTKP